MRDFPVYFGLGLVFLIGLGIFSLGARNLWRAIVSKRWPAAPATVVESATRVERSTGESLRSRKSVSSTVYLANIQFEYKVQGRSYRTDQIYIGQTVGSGDSSEAELRRFRYPLGAAVTLSYDPADPSIASVHPGFQAEVLWLPGAGLAFLVPAVMGWIFFRSAFAGASGFAIGLSIFSLVFVTVGGIILFFGGRALWRGWQSSSWPTARGAIVFGRVDETRSVTYTGDGESYVSTTSSAPVIFRFEAGGREHFSNTRRFGQLAGSSAEWAESIAHRYPLGREVTVWYCPDDPDLATLEPGVSKEAFWAPGAGAAFFLFGLAALVFGVPALTRDPF